MFIIIDNYISLPRSARLLNIQQMLRKLYSKVLTKELREFKALTKFYVSINSGGEVCTACTVNGSFQNVKYIVATGFCTSKGQIYV